MFSVSVLAGSVSTTVFVASTLPMLIKAARTKDLGSYSVGNLVLANLGNLVYAVYVVSLPVGPIWALHSFYMVSSFAMLVMWLNYRRRLRSGIQPDAPPPGIHGDAPRRADRALPDVVILARRTEERCSARSSSDRRRARKSVV